jgi:hypothetical protein
MESSHVYVEGLVLHLTHGFLSELFSVSVLRQHSPRHNGGYVPLLPMMVPFVIAFAIAAG